MDDPLFDPWGSGDQPGSAVREGRRWLSSRASTPGSRAPQTARLAGVPGFLRTMATPRLEDVALRLRMARHEVTVEDALDRDPPAVRLGLRPWVGPFADRAPVWSTFELAIGPHPEGELSVRATRGDVVTAEERLPAARVGAAWLDASILAFVRGVLRDP